MPPRPRPRPPLPPAVPHRWCDACGGRFTAEGHDGTRAHLAASLTGRRVPEPPSSRHRERSGATSRIHPSGHDLVSMERIA